MILHYKYALFYSLLCSVGIIGVYHPLPALAQEEAAGQTKEPLKESILALMASLQKQEHLHGGDKNLPEDNSDNIPENPDTIFAEMTKTLEDEILNKEILYKKKEEEAYLTQREEEALIFNIERSDQQKSDIKNNSAPLEEIDLSIPEIAISTISEQRPPAMHQVSDVPPSKQTASTTTQQADEKAVSTTTKQADEKAVSTTTKQADEKAVSTTTQQADEKPASSVPAASETAILNKESAKQLIRQTMDSAYKKVAPINKKMTELYDVRYELITADNFNSAEYLNVSEKLNQLHDHKHKIRNETVIFLADQLKTQDFRRLLADYVDRRRSSSKNSK